MGRTFPSATQVFLQEEEELQRFRRALRKEDQQVFDSLMDLAQKHISATAYAGSVHPFEMLLLALLIEEHKEVQRLRELIEQSSGNGSDAS